MTTSLVSKMTTSYSGGGIENSSKFKLSKLPCVGAFSRCLFLFLFNPCVTAGGKRELCRNCMTSLTMYPDRSRKQDRSDLIILFHEQKPRQILKILAKPPRISV